MARHLLYFQQVIQKKIIDICTYFENQAGLTSSEVKSNVWEWEEELRKLNLENIGLGKTTKTKSYNHR